MKEPTIRSILCSSAFILKCLLWNQFSCAFSFNSHILWCLLKCSHNVAFMSLVNLINIWQLFSLFRLTTPASNIFLSDYSLFFFLNFLNIHKVVFVLIFSIFFILWSLFNFFRISNIVFSSYNNLFLFWGFNSLIMFVNLYLKLKNK